MDFVVYAIAFFLFCVWLYRSNKNILFVSKDPTSSLPLPPGSMGWPFVGKSFEMSKSGYFEFLSKQVKKYGNVSKTHFYGSPSIVLVGAENVKAVWLGENKNVQMGFTGSIRDLFGKESILCSTGKLHSKIRSLMLKPFTPKQIEEYIPVIEKIARKYVKKWGESADAGTARSAQPDLLELAFEVIATTMLGREPDMILVEKYNEWVKGLGANKLNFPGTQYWKSMKCREFILQYIEKVILEKQSERRNMNDDKASNALELFLSAAYDAGEKLTMEQMKDQLLVMLFAGHSTTSAVLCSFIGEVWRNEDLMEKLYQEQLRCRPDPDAPFLMEQLREMPLLHMTMWEAIRVQPPIAIQSRKAIKTFALEGYQIPKGWMIYIFSHHNITTLNDFTNKSQLDPERFSEERNEGQKAGYAFKPFGAGKRSCIGEPLAWHEMQIFLSVLLRSYTWKPRNYPPPYICPVFLHVTDGLPVNVEKRPN